MVLERPALLDATFHALAHPARRAMLGQLLEGEKNLTELAAPLSMSFPGASKHVRVLESAGLVRRTVVGREHVCRLEGGPLEGANQWLENYRRVWEANFTRLDVLLAEMQSPAASASASIERTRHPRRPRTETRGGAKKPRKRGDPG